MAEHLFTSESVTEGHPDKLCDQIADAVLDAVLRRDPRGRVACEVLVKGGLVVVAGEITHQGERVDLEAITRATVLAAGYDRPELGFDGHSCTVLCTVARQSPDIARGVSPLEPAGAVEQGAGDQGMVFGFACDETPELMPLPITLAHRLARQLAEVRKRRILPFLAPDGKTQVTVRYREGRPVAVDTVVLSAQHREDVEPRLLHEALLEEVLKPSLPASLRRAGLRVLINPTGRFVQGGPAADAGLTGRKVIVDTYGGMARHGGGAFSGKDPSKTDRAAAYYARYIAKNLVAAGLCRRVEVQLAYAIGVARPVSVMVDSGGTGIIDDPELAELVQSELDARPAAIIQQLDLLRPIYLPTATYGHFGRHEGAFTWERTDRAAQLADQVTAATELEPPDRPAWWENEATLHPG